jgi:hypothetical protein
MTVLSLCCATRKQRARSTQTRFERCSGAARVMGSFRVDVKETAQMVAHGVGCTVCVYVCVCVCVCVCACAVSKVSLHAVHQHEGGVAVLNDHVDVIKGLLQLLRHVILQDDQNRFV